MKRTTDSPNPTANDTISDTHDKKRRRLSSGHQNGNSSWDSPESLSPLESGLSAPLRKYDNLSSASRTAKYAFSHLPSQISTEDDEDPKSKQRKQKLHRQFITRLGRPDSLAEINKRNEASVDADADALEADSDAEPQPSKNVTSKRSISSRKSGKLTPMEKQVVDIKRKYPDTLMVVEVGYKYRFFGEDARVAAKELSIVCLSGKMRFDERMFPASFLPPVKILTRPRSLRSPSRAICFRKYPHPSSPRPCKTTSFCWPQGRRCPTA